MTIDDLLKKGIAAYKDGRNEEAQGLLKQVVQQDRQNELAWLWLSGTFNTDAEQRKCLERVLSINPDNVTAQRGIKALQMASEAVSTAAESVEPQPKSDDRKKSRTKQKSDKRKKSTTQQSEAGVNWKWLALGSAGTTVIFLVGCLTAYALGVIQFTSIDKAIDLNQRTEGAATKAPANSTEAVQSKERRAQIAEHIASHDEGKGDFYKVCLLRAFFLSPQGVEIVPPQPNEYDFYSEAPPYHPYWIANSKDPKGNIWEVVCAVQLSRVTSGGVTVEVVPLLSLLYNTEDGYIYCEESVSFSLSQYFKVQGSVQPRIYAPLDKQ